jgi:competence protein ComEA
LGVWSRSARPLRTLGPDSGDVPELSRSQLLVYGAVAVAVLLVGARWIRSSHSEGSASSSGLSFAAHSSPGATSGRDVVVHVAGAVRKPGVYRLPAGARVTDAVRRAGGFAQGASEDAINLAARLSDGQQVVVPGPGTASASSAGGAQNGPISLGGATVEQLDQIEGIGPVTAQKIIVFRDQHGGLSSINQLDQVDGIGPSTMEALRAGLQP